MNISATPSGLSTACARSVVAGSLLPVPPVAGNTPVQGSKPAKQSHRQFWLGISTTAAKHSCSLQPSLQQLQAMRCEASSNEAPSTSGRGDLDLLIAGPGVLGSLLGKLWKDAHSMAEVVGQTNSDANHQRLRKLGIIPRLKHGCGEAQFPNVVFSAPPSGSNDYVAEVKHALRLWDRQGTFIFTSSSSVYDPPMGHAITEETPLHPLGSSERIDRLLKSEQAVLDAGGCVVRLVGLYHANRGAHTFFLRQREVPRWSGHLVNLVHYEDAACLCLKVLQHEGSEHGPYRKRIFLGADAASLTFKEMMDATLASGAFSGEVEFTGPAEAGPAPQARNDATREILKWTPKYTSFKSFMLAGAKDFYTESEAFA